MSVAENKDVIRRIYAAMEQGDTSVFGAHVHPDYVWRIAGQCSWSGTFEGREAILRDLIRPLFARFATTYKAKLKNVIGEDDFVVAEVDGDVVTKDGGRYNNNYCFVFRFRGNKIAEVVEYADTDLEERVLGRYDDALVNPN
ncbi:MAG TPA: nuclear transport factor 2 family protein [Candidatus Baltobacteraceae bacterium]|nr:nuclear transport factor 2 family protein [Candidatus Baltobacteraceae bacterium]